jgi:anti-sigma regulatory factor (Ser/Thr protein kinase)
MAVDLSLTLPREQTAAGMARREMARRLPVESLGDVALVVSELINNALVHGRGEIRLALRLDGGRVWARWATEVTGLQERAPCAGSTRRAALDSTSSSD